MDHYEMRYTVGMDDAEVAEYLADHDVAVLSLADGGVAYAVPVNYHYDGDSLYLRLLDDEDSTKMSFLGATESACVLLYGVAGDVSYSVVARGRLRELAGDERAAFDDATVNEEFGAVRVFGEDVTDLDVAIYELEDAAITGRRTPEARPPGPE
jgi:nitroimidazol reductase NimA-like FMN-containing flavoprotein (pyridoxamine 5'-phosphate oxidase superfamily)